MFWSTLILAANSIRRNLLRSFLTILGIVIGVAAVITMVTLGRGATQSVSEQISAMGTNMLLIRPGQRRGPGSENAPKFRQRDVDIVKEQFDSISGVAPYTSISVTTVYQSRNYTTVVTGSTNDYFDVGNWAIDSGRKFLDSELRAGKAVCIIGKTVKSQLFGPEDPVGLEFRIKKFSCKVVGVLGEKGQSTWGSDQDDTIVMPLKTVQRRLTGSLDIDRISVSVRDTSAISGTQKRLEALFRELRSLGENEESDFRVLDMRQIVQTLTGTTKILTALLGAVAAVSLLVGGIGIMNIMLVSVTERTREIGIRLAIGALEKHVLMQFLIEAIVLSSLGGLLGLALAVGLSTLGANAMGFPLIFDPVINLIAFLFSAGIGVLFGYMPARRAARLNPIDALRHE